MNDFWNTLGFPTRKKLLQVHAFYLLRKIKEQHQRVCSCTVCGRNKVYLDRELERLFSAFCNLLVEQCSGSFVFNFCTSPAKFKTSKLRQHDQTPKTTKKTVRNVINKEGTTTEITKTTVKKNGNVHVIEKTVKYYSNTGKIIGNENNYTMKAGSSPIIEDITEDTKERAAAPKQHQSNPVSDSNGSQQTASASQQHNLPPPPHQEPNDETEDDFFQYEFQKHLTISRDGIITLSEDWIKENHQSDIVQLLQRLEHYIKHSNLESLILDKVKKISNEDDDEYDDDNDDDEDEDDQCSDEDNTYESDESEEDDEGDDDSVCESVDSDSEKYPESKKLFCSFTAKSFYENILTAFREKQALDMQAKLIEEEEMKEKEKSEKKMKKKKEQEKKKHEQEKQRKMEEERKKIEKEMIEIVKKEKKKKREVAKESDDEEQEVEETFPDDAQEPEITHVLFENDMSDVAIKTAPEQFPRYQPKPVTSRQQAKSQKKQEIPVPIQPAVEIVKVEAADTFSNDTVSTGNTSTGNNSVGNTSTNQPVIVQNTNVIGGGLNGVVSHHEQIVSEKDQIVQTNKSPSPPNQQQQPGFSNWQPMNNSFQFSQFLPNNPVNHSFNSQPSIGNNAFQNPVSQSPFMGGFYNNQNTQTPQLFNLFGQPNQTSGSGQFPNVLPFMGYSSQYNTQPQQPQPRMGSMNANMPFSMAPSNIPMSSQQQYQQWMNYAHHNPIHSVGNPFPPTNTNSSNSLFASDTIGMQQPYPSSNSLNHNNGYPNHQFPMPTDNRSTGVNGNLFGPNMSGFFTAKH